jgi:hypothetical protein
MIDVYGIPEDLLSPNLWEFAVLFIQASCDQTGTEDIEDIYKWIKDRSVQLWIVAEDDLPVSACITEIHKYPKISICTVRHYGGKLTKEIYDQLSWVVSTWAKGQGCSRLQLLGRPGWQKLAGAKISRSFFVLQSDLTGD